MKLFIPTLGTPLRLLSDWTFALYYERRNSTLLDALLPAEEQKLGSRWMKYWGDDCHVDGDYSRELKHIDVVLPAKSLLIVDRIYIRKGSDDFSSFDSITFNLRETSHPSLSKVKRGRFWVKLLDANALECETEYPKELILRSRIRPKNEADLDKTVQWLCAMRFDVAKISQGDIIAFGPKKRYESVFQQKVKMKRGEGYVWQHPLIPSNRSLVGSVHFIEKEE
jgi:hypothetical protein